MNGETQSIGILRALRGALRFDRGRKGGFVDTPVEKSPFAEGPAISLPATTEGGGDPGYYQKLTNLFPAEALAIYGTGTAIFGTANIVVVVVGLMILLVLRTIANREAKGSKTDWRAVAVAAVSYLLWVTSNDAHWLATLSGALAANTTELRKYAAFFGAAVVLLAPVIAPTPEAPVA